MEAIVAVGIEGHGFIHTLNLAFDSTTAADCTKQLVHIFSVNLEST